MATYKTHLTALEASAEAHPSYSALKIPFWSPDGETHQGWRDITYFQFLSDVEQCARYWFHELTGKGLKGRSVVGLWLKGSAYLDAVHIWGVSRAGFVPQLISLRITSPSVVHELLDAAKAKGFIYDPSFAAVLKDQVPSFPAIDPLELDLKHLSLPDLWHPSADGDIVMIFHSSGSTSGRPKLVPLTAKWLEFNLEKFKLLRNDIGTTSVQDIMAANGSFCHLAASFCLMSIVEQGGCLLIPTKTPYSSDEFRMMVDDHGVNRLVMFSSFLGDFIREARKSPTLLTALQKLRTCSHGGLPLESDDDEWARLQGINLINVFGSTEVGGMMQSIGGQGEDARLLRPFPGTKYSFVPISDSSDSEDSSSSELLELVVGEDSPDCPHPTLRDEQGNFRTGDLFSEVSPGHYLSKGRNDDWIKMKISLRCDTRSIEDNAMELCANDLINTAVVVGSGRQSPALFIEPNQDLKHELRENHSSLKKEILGRIGPFHERRYMHERIDDARLIFVVPQSTLPRTGKGSIQRRIVEKQFQEDLDRIYATVYS